MHTYRSDLAWCKGDGEHETCAVLITLSGEYLLASLVYSTGKPILRAAEVALTLSSAFVCMLMFMLERPLQ